MMDFMKTVRSAGEIIGAAAGMLKKRWDVMLACILPVFLPLLAAQWLTDGQLSVLFSYAAKLATPVAGAVAAIIVDEEPNGGATVSRVFDRLRGRWPAIIAVSFIQSIITAVGFFLLVVPGLIWTAWTFAAPAVVVLEREHDIFGSFRRAKELAKNQFGHIWGTLILGWIIVAIACALGLGVTAPLIPVFGTQGGRGIAFLYGAGYAVIQTFVGFTSAILFFDLRARQALERWPKAQLPLAPITPVAPVTTKDEVSS